MILQGLFLFGVVFELHADNLKPTKVMRMLSHTFGTHVLACQKESKLSEDIISEFLNYWNASTVLDDLNMGCVVKCILDKLDLLDAGGFVKRINAEAFVIASGSDENTSKALTELFQICRGSTKGTEPCELALYIARCFRAGIYMLEWTPNLKDPVPDLDS